MIKRSTYIEQMETAIEEGGPGSAIKMQGLRDLLHENTRTAGNDGVIGRVVDAKRRINAAMAVLGKFAGDAVWSVIGEDMSLREFVQRQATNGRPISVNEVKGRVISGLDILADHYRI